MFRPLLLFCVSVCALVPWPRPHPVSSQVSASVSLLVSNTLSTSVFNYNQTLRNINRHDYRNASSSSDCQSSTFCNEPYGHVITGDLRIVSNKKLRRLLEKGPKYRQQNNIDCHLNKKILTKAVDDYARNCSKREGCHMSALRGIVGHSKTYNQQQDKQFTTCKFSSLS